MFEPKPAILFIKLYIIKMKLSEKETNLYFKSSPVELLSVELEAKKYMPLSGMLKLLPMTTSEAVGMLIFSQSSECSE